MTDVVRWVQRGFGYVFRTRALFCFVNYGHEIQPKAMRGCGYKTWR